ncbi:MAG: FtsX-like permease family protein [Bacteroidales bacterium]|nr:FtsX-like permease family protein [Bacteroidales bacterium]
MLKNYLTISLRNILKNRFFTFVNIFGLSIGIATSILIYLYIMHELSYDKEQPKYERIYRVVSDNTHENKVEHEAITPNPLIPTLRNEMTIPEGMTRIIFWENGVFSCDNKKYKLNNLLFIEPQFFDVFSVEWLVGSPSVFKSPNVAVITESTARKLFGTLDVINKPIKLNGKSALTIMGLIKDSRLTNIPFTILISYESYPKLEMPFAIDSWSTTISGFQSFLVLKDINDSNDVERQINRIVKKSTSERDSSDVFSLQPLSKVRTDITYGRSNLNGFTDPTYLVISAIVGFFVLLLGCINYINLSLSILIKRHKEIGIRKVNGALSTSIIKQFTLESILTIIISFLIAILLAEIVLPYLSNLLDGQIYKNVYQLPSVFLFMTVLIVILITITGILPSLKVSSIKAIEIFRKSDGVKGMSSYSFRNILIVIQFLVSVVLIASTFIIAEQIKFLRTKELGYSTKNIINCPITSNKRALIDDLKGQLLAMPDVEKVSFSLGAPTSGSNANTGFQSPYKKDGERSLVSFKCVDYDYAETFDIKLIAGRWWNAEVRNDSVNEFLVNETFIKRLGFPRDNESLGTVISIAGNKGPIIGVIKDFHSSSLRNSIEPLLFAQIRQLYYNLSIKLKPNYSPNTIKQIQDKWQTAFPDDIWEYQYFDDSIKEQYKGDERTFKLAVTASWIAICIALLGLFGISGYTIQQKTKTICLRKFLGAEVPGLIIYLSKRFVYMVLIANIIGLPIAYYAINKWLSQFAYHVNINLIYFAATLLLSVLISILIISYYAVRTANQNPAVVLRNE